MCTYTQINDNQPILFTSCLWTFIKLKRINHWLILSVSAFLRLALIGTEIIRGEKKKEKVNLFSCVN